MFSFRIRVRQHLNFIFSTTLFEETTMLVKINWETGKFPCFMMFLEKYGGKIMPLGPSEPPSSLTPY